jgi:hypothetical protein
MTKRLDYVSNAPDGMNALAGVRRYIGQSGLPKKLADLTIAIGLMNAYNRIAISFRTPAASVKA